MISPHRHLVTFCAAIALVVPFAHAQDAKSAATKGSAAQAKPRAGDDEALATVNGEPITKGEVIRLLGSFEMTPGSEQRAYDAALDTLIDGKLIEQFMRKSKVPVAKADIERFVDGFRKNLAQEGSSLENYLAITATSPEQFNKFAESAAQWENYVVGEARDAILKKYLDDNRDAFSGAQVKASHILLEVPPNTAAEAKEEIRKKLLAIKAEIASGKITFADAANKYSEDKGNKSQPSGGNLGYFPRKGVFIEPFAAAAFGMKVGDISDPIETEYGLHLIQLVDRKPGETVVFSEEIKPFVMRVFAEELQEKLTENQRKTAKIEKQPMPADLFRMVAQQPAQAAAAAAPTTKPAAEKTK